MKNSIEKMLKKGFEILSKKTTAYDVAKLEQAHGISLPPILKLFLTYFDICADMFGKWDSSTGINSRGCFWISKSESWHAFTFLSFKLEGKDIFMEDYASSIPELFQQWHNDRFEFWQEMGLLQILVTGGGGFFVGIQEENKDAIFLARESMAEPQKIANNIFEFIDGLEQIANEKLLSMEGASLDKLYQNWGEDFWRVREKSE